MVIGVVVVVVDVGVVIDIGVAAVVVTQCTSINYI